MTLPPNPLPAMRTAPLLTFAVLAVLAASPGHAAGQSVDEIRAEYSRRIIAADQEGATALDFVRAAEAARFMRDFKDARGYLDAARATGHTESEHSAILTEALWQALATGGGVDAVKRIFREAVQEEQYAPTVIAGWLYFWPEALVGGEYDDLIQRLSLEATDPRYRCECYATKAWMHRVAGRADEARVYWGLFEESEREIPNLTSSFDEADWRARSARNLARAGQLDEARAELQRAMEVDLSAFESMAILRRRAQTYAELGEVDRAVADLENLLAVPSLVTYYTLRDRLTWAPIRETDAFQELLERHRPH